MASYKVKEDSVRLAGGTCAGSKADVKQTTHEQEGVSPWTRWGATGARWN
jgi:hypothetical protein